MKKDKIVWKRAKRKKTGENIWKRAKTYENKQKRIKTDENVLKQKYRKRKKKFIRKKSVN
jgi:hypothetical protein